MLPNSRPERPFRPHSRYRARRIRKAQPDVATTHDPCRRYRLYTVDAPGGTPALLFLAAAWHRAELDPRHPASGREYRTVRFDARARGSRADQPTTPCRRPSTTSGGSRRDRYRTPDPRRLVSWRNDRGAIRGSAPRQVGGLVLIDGAYPVAMLDEAGKQKVRSQFRRLGWIMRILAALGRSARMSPSESADVVIEMDAVNGELGPTSRRWNARPFSSSAPAHTRAPPRRRCGRCGLLSLTPSEQQRVSVSQLRPTSTRRSSTRRPTLSSPRSRTSSASLSE